MRISISFQPRCHHKLGIRNRYFLSWTCKKSLTNSPKEFKVMKKCEIFFFIHPWLQNLAHNLQITSVIVHFSLDILRTQRKAYCFLSIHWWNDKWWKFLGQKFIIFWQAQEFTFSIYKHSFFHNCNQQSNILKATRLL